MARKHPRRDVSRRKFLAGVAVAGAASAVPPAQAATTEATSAAPRLPSALPPTMHVAAAETGTPKELSGARIGGVGRKQQKGKGQGAMQHRLTRHQRTKLYRFAHSPHPKVLHGC